MRLAHISDTHFGTEDGPVCAALRNELRQEAPDLVVLTGDITQRARPAQFRAARAFLDGLGPVPVLALPGNHDLPLFDLLTRFTAPYRHFQRYLNIDLAPIWLSPQLAVVTVNSTGKWRHKHGELAPDRVQAVAAQLASLAQPFKVVALHHPLAVIDPADLRNRARGAETALAAWTAAGADLFLGGHIHLPYCVLVGSGRRPAVVLQAGTAVSHRRRAGQPNSYNLVRLEAKHGRRMTIERRDYEAGASRFTSAAAWEAKDGADGWTLWPGI